MANDEFRSGEPVPVDGLYEELNVFGVPDGKVTFVAQGQLFPATPRGHSWRPLTAKSTEELRALAADYRRLSQSAATRQVADGLRTIADRLDEMADRQQREGRSGS